ncbi:MAG: amidohydrolase family protein, partial [Tepidiformaceae bacterium]
LFASGGVMTPGVDPRSPSYTQDELTAGVEEAHKAFRVVGAHAQAADGIKNAIRAGVDSIEHGVWLDEEAVALMVERGTYMVATLTAPFHIAHGASSGIPPYMVDKGQQVLEDHIASFRAATQAGVNLAMGTDQGTPLSRPGENAQEILRLAEHGLSNGAAIMAATGWAADLLHVDAGRISEGLLADFAVFEDDPLMNLAVLADGSQVAAVVKDGSVFRHPHHSRSEVTR